MTKSNLTGRNLSVHAVYSPVYKFSSSQNILLYLFKGQLCYLHSKACLVKYVHHFVPIDVDLSCGARLHFDPHWLSSSENTKVPSHPGGALSKVPSLQSSTSPEGQSRPMKEASPIFELF